MLKQALSVVGIAAGAVAMVVTPAAAIANSDGSTTSLQGAGGTNVTGTHGDNSPNFHTLDNPNICLPRVDHIQVGLVPVQAEIPIANQQPNQYCNVGHTTQGTGDGQLSHLIG